MVAAQELGEDLEDRRPAVITCDVAREGDDLAVIGRIKHRKFNLMHFTSPEYSLPARIGWWSTSSTTTLARYLAAAARVEKARYVVVDDTGVGGGVTDQLREMATETMDGTDERFLPGGCSIIPVNFGQAARRPDRFDKRKDELWWSLREALKLDEKQLEPRLALPTDREIALWKTPKKSDFKKQLLQTIYESQMDETIKVYDKRLKGKEKTKPLPEKSPDLAHSLIIGVDLYLNQEQPEIVQVPTNQQQAIARMIAEQVERLTKRPVKNPYLRR